MNTIQIEKLEKELILNLKQLKSAKHKQRRKSKDDIEKSILSDEINDTRVAIGTTRRVNKIKRYSGLTEVLSFTTCNDVYELLNTHLKQVKNLGGW